MNKKNKLESTRYPIQRLHEGATFCDKAKGLYQRMRESHLHNDKGLARRALDSE